MSNHNIIDGHLHKAGPGILQKLSRRWTWRRFTLFDGGRGLQLHYYDGETEKGTIYLRDCDRITKQESYCGRHNIIVLATKNSGRKYHLSAKDQDEMNLWYKTINDILSERHSTKKPISNESIADRRESGYASMYSGNSFLYGVDFIDGAGERVEGLGNGTEHLDGKYPTESYWRSRSSSGGSNNSQEELAGETITPIQEEECEKTL
ncbi:uncharacterized protein LOC135685763 [Rhopilema esculentum]|uniref:uncharacterized protein LOC135685763 n=1 Tax=Rhopilema esculentum TaxID=499914 RepID=UPI0031D25C67